MRFAFAPRPRAARRRAHSLVDVTLDPAQRTAVEKPPGGALLVLGEAGHGKTTVALHRLVHLWRTHASPEPLRAAVVVPTEGLERLMQPLLRRLGVDLEVWTYDRWASRQARRAFRRLPRESEGAPPVVVRLKRSPSLRLALDDLAAVDPTRVDDDPEAPAPSRRALVSRGDLQHLFGDRRLLERVAHAGALGPRAVAETLDWTRRQFALRAEDEWAHVTDRERLVAVDGRALDDGTASGPAGTMDVEDYAVLFELAHLRVTRSPELPPARMRPVDVLVLDEAQELAPLELALLGRSLSPGGTLVVGGDADQQTDATTSWLGWEAAMRELGRPGFDTVRLEVGYRCPPDVVALSRAIVAPSVATHAGPPAHVHTFETEATRAAWAARELHELKARDRGASIVVLCRAPLTARRLADALHAADVPARVVWDGRFLARGPVQVTTVDEVKGLEFDYVLVPDAGAADYPDTAAARRMLYVAVTRARQQVVLACVGEPSPVVG